jgi:hypothetical protein
VRHFGSSGQGFELPAQADSVGDGKAAKTDRLPANTYTDECPVWTPTHRSSAQLGVLGRSANSPQDRPDAPDPCAHLAYSRTFEAVRRKHSSLQR